jgi:hypothetical protein
LKRIAYDSSAPSYVRLGALQAVLEHQQAKAEPDPNKPAKKEPATIEEPERFLEEQCGQQRDAAHRRNALHMKVTLYGRISKDNSK